MLNVQLEEQLIHAYGTHAVVLCNLCDGHGLRAAQDDSCVVGQRVLLYGDFFELCISAFEYTVLLLQFVSSVLADSWKDFRCDPPFESSCAIEFG